MCILLVVRRPGMQGELWIAANRDEDLHRPWEPPRLLTSAPPVFGGRDLVGGGSWLAVNLEAGFVVGVTNARRGAVPGVRSRGRLVVDLAGERGTADAVAMLSELDLSHYGAFNLVLADGRESWLATNAPAPLIERGAGEVSAAGNDPLGAPGERVVHAADRASDLLTLSGDTLARELERLLADHEGDDPLCRHGERYGTVCSSVITLAGGAVTRYLFAPGPPCTTAFETVNLTGLRPTLN